MQHFRVRMTEDERREIIRLRNRVILVYAALMTALVVIVSVHSSWQGGAIGTEAHAKGIDRTSQAQSQSVGHR